MIVNRRIVSQMGRWRIGHPALAPALGVLLAISVVSGASLAVFGPQTYTRGAGAPIAVKKTFRVDRPSGKYTLHVTNHGVTSGVISLNGRVIVDSDDFTTEKKGRDGGPDADQRDARDPDNRVTDRRGADDDIVTSLQRTVTVRSGSNEIVVELQSKPGTSLVLEIDGSVAATLPVAHPGGPYTGNVG